MSRITSPDLMKINNKKTILEIIYKQRNIYRAQIADMTNLSNQTITNLVKELLADQLIKEVTLEKKSKGRNPMALSINAETLFTIGIELSVKGITVCTFDLNHRLISEIRSDLKKDNLEELKLNIGKSLESLDKSKVIGIAISIEGIVDEVSGLVIKSKDIGMNGINILSELAYLNMPVQVRNDVNMLAETDSNRSKDKNYMLVKLDRGIGAAFVLGGRIHRSDNNAAGEFGHTTVYGLKTRSVCKCGKSGCLTTVASVSAIETHLQLTMDEIEKKYNMNDTKTVEYIDEISEYISRPLANLITVLDLNSVILTGSIVKRLGSSFTKSLLIHVYEKLNGWVSFNGLRLLDDYEMVYRCSKCVVDTYFINWKKEGVE